MADGNSLTPGRPPFAPPLIGGLAAAVMHGLADRIDEPTAPGRRDRFRLGTEHDIDVNVDPRRRVARTSGYRFIRSARSNAFEAGGVPCTSIVDTVLDLCDLSTTADAIAWVDRACQQRLTTAGKLAAGLEGRSRAKHRPALIPILGGHVDGVTSEMERVYKTDVEEAHGLPRAKRQRRAGNRFLDNRYEEYGAIVELDGLIGHTGEGRFRDRHRDNVHTMADQRSLRYGWEDCYFEPCGVAAQVAHLLRILGWSGAPILCPICPPDVFAHVEHYFT